MDANAILELIGKETAEHLNTSQRAGRLGNYTKAAEAQASAQTLMDLQRKIKALNGTSLPTTSPMYRPAPAPVAATPAMPRKPVITQPKRDFGSSKSWSLDSRLRPGDIDKILGNGKAAAGKAFRRDDDPSKVKFSWAFLVDGKECAIWDYKGTRWSGYGPKECFEALGIIIEGR